MSAWSKGSRVDIELVSFLNGFSHSLLWRRLLSRLARIGSWASPCPLPSGEDAINHVQPIEERVDHKHEWVEHDLVSPELGSEIQHQHPVQSKRDSYKADWQIGDLLRGAQNGDDHDEEQQRRGSDRVLRKTYDKQ